MMDSRYKLKTGQEVDYFPPIQNTDSPYASEAAMHADQANQLQGYGYLVDGVGAFTYLGTVAGTAADYEGFGANLRLSNLAADLSTAEQDGIKTKLSMEGVSASYATTLLFDNIFGKFLGTRNQTAVERFTVATTGNKIGGTIHIHFISDGVNPINFSSGFEFLHGIDSGTILPAGNYEFYFVYKANGRVSVNVNKGIYKMLSYSYAYRIDGSGQNMTVANSVDFVKPLSGAFSVGYWVLNLNTSSKFLVGIIGSGGRTWSSNFTTNSGEGKLTADLTILNSGGSQYIQHYSHPARNTNTWYFVVATYDGSGTRAGIKTYINGQLDISTQPPLGAVSISTINNQGAFGVGMITGYQSVNSQCDQLWYANRVVTAAEISNTYALGKAALISELPFYTDIVDGWNFNQSLISSRGTHNGTATNPLYITA